MDENRFTITSRIGAFSRDYLIPALELMYEIGCAVQNLVMSLLKLNGTNIFPVPVTSFWTPYSNRSFLPSCCAALDFSKEERDYLGGWSQVSDWYARIFSNLQRAVARTIQQGPQGDSLGEQETRQEFEDLMLQKNVAPEILCLISSAISSGDPVLDFSVSAALEVESVPELTPIIDDEPSIPTAEPEVPAAKNKRGGQAGLSYLPVGQALNPYGPSSWRMNALLDIDYLRWSYSGIDMPKSSEYDVFCTSCSRQGVASSSLSSGTESSSSTIEDEA